MVSIGAMMHHEHNDTAIAIIGAASLLGRTRQRAPAQLQRGRHAYRPFWLLVACLWLLCLSPASWAAIEYVSDSSAGNSNNQSTLTVSRPAGVQSGDLLLAQISWRGSRNLSAVPTGWTLRQLQLNGTTIRQAVYSKLATNIEPTSYTWQFSGSGRNAGGISVWRGVDSSDPVLSSAGNSNISSTLVAPSLAVSTTNTVAVALFANAYGNTSISTNASLSNLYSLATTAGSNGLAIAAGWRNEPAAGTLGPYYASATYTYYVATTIILKPAATVTLTCLPDDFNRSALGSDWATASISGSFGAPRIVSNRMRITDSSGNVSTAATLQRLFPTTGNLIVVEFKYYAYSSSNASGADGVAVIFSDASITPQPGGFGGSLGYAQRSGIDGFAGGWLAVGLDEYGNFSNPTEGRVGGPGFRADAITVRGSGSGTSGYRYISGTTSLSPGVDDDSFGSTAAPGHSYRITIDARTAGIVPVTIERDTSGGTAYSTLLSIANVLAAIGQDALPEDLMLSFTGSTGGSVNVHEIDDLGVCAINMEPLTTVDHFRFITDGEGLTCTPESITVLACADSSCSTQVAEDVDVTLSPTGWVGGDSQTLSNGAGILQLQRTTPTATALALDVLSSDPPLKAFANSPQCFTSGNTPIACEIMFRDAGLVFDVPTLTANRTATNISIQALRTAPPSGVCVPAWEGEHSVNFFSGYVTPATGTLPVSVNGNTIGGSAATATPILLDFDATGTAQISVHYADAGAMQLSALYNGSAGTGDAGLVLTGSDQFVSLPAGFCVQAKTLANSAVAQPNCANSSCPMYQRAGVNFPFTVTAMAWQVDGETDTAFCSGNASTPNFAGTVSLNHDMLDSAIEGNFSASNVSLTAGSYSGNGQFSEVGRFSLTTAGSYLGESLPSSTSAAIGRIVPDHYELAVSGYDAHCTAGDDFSYAGLKDSHAGESFTVAMAVNAVNAGGVITRNYQGSYARLQNSAVSFVDRNAGADATDGEFVNDGHQLEFVEGVGTPRLIATGATGAVPAYYQFLSARAPYTVALRLDVSDSDSISGSSPEQGPIEFRLGRLAVDNAYGPEQLPLPIPLRAEYFDGSRWRRNAADSCSEYIRTAVSRDQFTGTLTDAMTPVENPVVATSLQSGLSLTSAPLRISAPGLNQYGSLRVQLNVPSWLQFDWNGDGSVDMPTATATFGRYRGSDRVIFWREQIPAKP